MVIYSGFTHWTWWFSIVMLVYQRVAENIIRLLEDFPAMFDSLIIVHRMCYSDMKSDEVWSFDGFPWMQSGGPSYHCQRRSQQLIMDHYTNCIPILDGWSLLHFFSQDSQGPAHWACPLRPKTCDLPGMFDHVSHLLALHLAARSRLRRLKRGNTDLKQGHLLQMPQKSIKMAKKGGVLYFETNPSFMLLAIECVYIYTLHTSYPIIYPLFAIISPLHPLQNG